MKQLHFLFRYIEVWKCTKYDIFFIAFVSSVALTFLDPFVPLWKALVVDWQTCMAFYYQLHGNVTFRFHVVRGSLDAPSLSFLENKRIFL